MLWGASFTVDASPQSEKVSWIWQEVPPWRIKQRNIMSYQMEQSSFLHRQTELRRQKKKLQRIPPEFIPATSLSILFNLWAAEAKEDIML